MCHNNKSKIKVNGKQSLYVVYKQLRWQNVLTK